MSGKEYGLILPGKKKEQKAHQIRTLNPLLDSDEELEKEEEEEDALNWVEASLKKAAGNAGQRSLQKRMLREALLEDSTVFQYDEVYDDMKSSQQENQQKQKETKTKKPKYIETILKHTEKRKLENERRQERKVQKEREAEGSEFADKESFVTPSYLKKLEELQKADQQNEMEKLCEEQVDVHKHKNFGVFYNHLLSQRMGETESEPRKKNYRKRGDLSDEEPPPTQIKDEVTVKEEVMSPSESENEDASHSQPLEYRQRRMIKKSNDKRERRRKQGRDEDANGRVGRRDRDTTGKELSRDMGRRDGSRDRNRRENSKDRNKQGTNRDLSRRGTSRDRSRRGESRDRTRRENSRDRSRRENSRDRGRRENSRDRSRRENSRDRSRRENTRDRNRREGSGERDRSRKERERGRNSTNEIDINEKGKVPKHENEEKKKSKDAPKKGKQDINTTLGSTNVNTMDIEQRIERFSTIFAKRTVSLNFEEAVRKYFERRAEREAAH